MNAWCVGLVLALVTATRFALAVPGETRVPPQRGYFLAYSAPAGCPERAALEAAIASRTPGAVSEGEGFAVVKLRAELGASGLSTLWLELPEGTSRREFRDATCADVVASMAVIASMVLEADASERATAARALFEPIPDEPAAAPGSSSAPTVVEPAALAVRPRAAPSPAPARPVDAPASPKPRDERRLGVALAAGVGVESAVASSMAWGGSVGLAFSLESQRRTWWTPTLQAEFFATLESSEQTPGVGEAELQLLTGRLHACPLRIPLTHRVRLLPCVTGDVGSLRARGAGEARNPNTSYMPWLALGGTLAAQVALGGRFSLHSSFAARGLNRADRFKFNEQYTAYKVPAWSLGASVGLVLSL